MSTTTIEHLPTRMCIPRRAFKPLNSRSQPSRHRHTNFEITLQKPKLVVNQFLLAGSSLSCTCDSHYLFLFFSYHLFSPAPLFSVPPSDQTRHSRYEYMPTCKWYKVLPLFPVLLRGVLIKIPCISSCECVS